jgi:Mn-containing catalase
MLSLSKCDSKLAKFLTEQYGGDGELQPHSGT